MVVFTLVTSHVSPPVKGTIVIGKRVNAANDPSDLLCCTSGIPALNNNVPKMPFPYTIPTTSSLSFAAHVSSLSHPSLPFSATTRRAVLRDALKQHRRLPPSARAPHLGSILSALNEYLPFLFALDAGLSGRKVAGEEVEVVLAKELVLSWRSTLCAVLPGRHPPRVKLQSLEYEIDFVLSTVAYTYTWLARGQLLVLYGPTTPSSEARKTAISTAMKYLLQSSAIRRYLLQRSSEITAPPPALDVSSPVFSALAALDHAEATLLAVLKDDPYPTVTGQDRNENDNEWMIKAPEIPKVRAHLFARLCLAAAEHAGEAAATLQHLSRVDEAVVLYATNLRKTARAKACRFFAIDADLGGKTGEAIAWLRGGKKELGYATDGAAEEGQKRTFGRWKRGWDEKREDKKIERGGEWGRDAGRLEEGRVLDMLEAKWVKMNDTINTQIIPPSDSLLATMPSGREIHTVQIYRPPQLDGDVLAKMRVPAEAGDGLYGAGDDDSDDDYDDRSGEASAKNLPGAFPATEGGPAAEGSYY